MPFFGFTNTLATGATVQPLRLTTSDDRSSYTLRQLNGRPALPRQCRPFCRQELADFQHDFTIMTIPHHLSAV